MTAPPACAWCAEPVLPGEASSNISNAAVHRECAFRMVAGGVNHQLGLCTCCGGVLPPDPPELTIRQAAVLALAAYRRNVR